MDMLHLCMGKYASVLLWAVVCKKTPSVDGVLLLA